uniref:Uncharacterized protein n=1 Tax=Siphoviridae sp. ctrgt10 TaxID=2826479 RepID=A0A8S5M7H8_9CAUD|nr:MAG TPA: hypothetical protein [Siphoviridae sp. ctrgt10]
MHLSCARCYTCIHIHIPLFQEQRQKALLFCMLKIIKSQFTNCFNVRFRLNYYIIVRNI